MTRPITRFKGPAPQDPTLPLSRPQEPHIARPSGDNSPILGTSKPLVPGLLPGTIPAPLFHSHRAGPYHCKVYIEWGGQYDVREVALVFWQGKYSYEDLTGGHLVLHNHLSDHDTLAAAKEELERFVFNLGESRTFIDYGSEQVWSPHHG